MFTVKPSAKSVAAAAAALLLLLMVAASSSVESADCTSLYRTCRIAVSQPGLARSRCCDGLFSSPSECYCEVVQRIRADGLNVGNVPCLRDGSSCPGSSLRGSDDSSSFA